MAKCSASSPDAKPTVKFELLKVEKFSSKVLTVSPKIYHPEFKKSSNFYLIPLNFRKILV